jgi:hypothetical protein
MTRGTPTLCHREIRAYAERLSHDVGSSPERAVGQFQQSERRQIDTFSISRKYCNAHARNVGDCQTLTSRRWTQSTASMTDEGAHKRRREQWTALDMNARYCLKAFDISVPTDNADGLRKARVTSVQDDDGICARSTGKTFGNSPRQRQVTPQNRGEQVARSRSAVARFRIRAPACSFHVIATLRMSQRVL